MYSFLKEEQFGLRTQLTFTGKKCEIYLPRYFLVKTGETTIANEMGDRIETVGMFWFNVDNKWYELQLPVKIQFQFSEVRKDNVKIKPEIPEEEYNIYTLYTGDIFVYDILHRQSIDNLKLIIDKFIEGGKMPKTTRYEDAFDVFLSAMEATNYLSLGVSAVTIEFLLSELYRNKRNYHEPFRMAYNGKNSFDFRMSRITKLPELNSTFTGLLGEDSNSQIISAIVKTRTGVAEKESPIEKIIKY